MNRLTARVVKRCCNLVLEVNPTMDTISGIIQFLRDQRIMVEEFRFRSVKTGHGYLYIDCHIEKYLWNKTMESLGKISGVFHVEKN